MTTLNSETETAARPRFSIVAAVYNVGRYLDSFIESIETQTMPWTQFEVIAVDDGSTDDSRARLEAWAARHPGRVIVLGKTNGGQSSARNLGMNVASGDWVTFTDPDDVLEPSYLEEVNRFLVDHPQTPMVATYRVFLNDATGEVSDTHPLRSHFAGRNSLRDLEGWPSHFHGSAPAAFFRRERIEQLNLRFDPEVRPNFEDGHFCVRYLLAEDHPAVGFVKTAVYKYRKRADDSSTLQTSLSNPDRYTKVLRNGYLQVLRAATADRRSVPEWLQNYVIYELSWYFTSQDAHAGGAGSASGEVAAEFHSLMAEICVFLDSRVIESFWLRPLRPSLRYILIHGYRDEAWREPSAQLDRLDSHRGLVRIRYHFTGPVPEDGFLVGGVSVPPAAQKVRSISYHDRTLMWERISWVSTRSTIRMSVDGRPQRLITELPELPRFGLAPSLVRKAFSHDRTVARAEKRQIDLSYRDRALLRLARSSPVRRRFADAWVLMDRIHDADDSGEILFRYLRKHRKEINAWFVVKSGTADWERLHEAGYKRVVAHGSQLWKLLMLNARHLISSHADLPVIAPPDIVRLTEPNWQFTFLQHGVIKDDLSAWLNPKPIDTFITSTSAEYGSIAGDDNAYVFTTKEVQLTGLPRFDKLRRIGRQVPEEQRDLILVTPTWREWLLPPLGVGSQQRTVSESFYRSEFAREWQGVLSSDAIALLCDEQKLTIGFLPHPNLQSGVGGLDLPPHIEVLSYDVDDVQRYFARAAVVLTDYSSIAFNAAYIERPVVYFQFDADRVLGGAHVGRQGYFRYDRDGFGPVATTLTEVEDAVAEVLRSGRRPDEVYQQRIEATFPHRDGRCSKRVTAAILASETRWRRPK